MLGKELEIVKEDGKIESKRRPKSVFERFNKVPYEHEYKHAREILVLHEITSQFQNEQQQSNDQDEPVPAVSYLDSLSEPPRDLDATQLGDRIESLWMKELAEKGTQKASLTRVLLKTVAGDLRNVLLQGFLFKLVGSLMVLESVRRVILFVGNLNVVELNESLVLSGDEKHQLPLDALDGDSSPPALGLLSASRGTNHEIPAFANDGSNFSLINETQAALIHKFESEEDTIRDKIDNYIYFLSFALILYAITYANFMYEQARCGLKLRVAITQLIQRKSMRLHLSSFVKEPSGSVVSLIANQATYVEDANRYMIHIVMAPISFISGLTWLAMTETGWLPLIGACVALCLSLSSQLCLPRLYKRISASQKQITKERVAAIEGFLNSIKTVKMYAWEPIFLNMIQKLRLDELRLVKKLDVFPIFDMVTLFATIRILSATVFISYLVLDKHLTPTVLFTTGLAFNMYVVDIVLLLPRSIKAIVELKEACKRAKAYMLLDEANGLEAIKIQTPPPDRKSPLAEVLSIFGTYKRTSSLWAGHSKIKPRLEVRLSSVSVSLAPNPSILDVTTLVGQQQQLLFNSSLMDLEESRSSHDAISNHPATIIGNLSMQMSEGELVVVTGAVGSGKSSLLLTLLGETHLTSGSISVSEPWDCDGIIDGEKLTRQRQFAYASQAPCIVAGSVRDNILMGRPFEPDRYRDVVSACSLKRDLQLLPQGDETPVGSRGVSLSGGQRARLNLARAVYSRAPAYLLDDPLAAVDSRVARDIFNNCIRGLLKDKLVVLATHQPMLVLSEASQLVVLEKGKPPIVGVPAVLLAQNEQVRSTLMAGTSPFDVDQQEPDIEPGNSQSEVKGKDSTVQPPPKQTEDPDQRPEGRRRSRTNSLAALKSLVVATISGQQAKRRARRQQAALQAASGSGQSLGRPCKSPYLFLGRLGLSRGSTACLVITLLVLVPTIGLNEYYFRTWAQAEISDMQTQSVDDMQYFKHSVTSCAKFVTITVVASLILCSFLAQLAWVKQRASKTIHDELIISLFGAKLSFFDFCQSGELSSRYAGDFAQIDNILPGVLLHSAFDWCWVAAYAIMIFVIAPACSLLIVALCLAITPSVSKHIKWKNKLIKLSNSLRSPVNSNAALVVESLDTIRSDSNYIAYVARNFQATVNRQTSMALLVISFNACISFALKLSAMLVGSLASYLMFVVWWESVDVAASGTFFILMITTMIRLPLAFEFLSFIETSMASVSNVSQLLNLEREEDAPTQEGKLTNEGKNLKLKKTVSRCRSCTTSKELAWHKFWSQGNIEFRNVTLRYFSDEPAVLNNLSFTIKAGEKVGVVGRTGAGKSSIVSAMLRLYPFEGHVVIDGYDTKSLELRKLRASLGVIPQDPVLFCDSLRRNLDPFDIYSDEEIWRALEVVNLRSFVVQNLASNLTAPISEGGRNFSVGQRQMVCLARAVLKSPKILLIDEATANVDQETDKLIQETIRSYFVSSTIITIAHRLDTVLDYDRILVLDAGKIVEFDSVQNLLNSDTSIFKSMLNESPAAKKMK